MEKLLEFKGKKLLVLGGLTLACDIVKHAQAMGAYVIVADYDENSPAKKIADDAVLINALDVDAIVNFCKKEKVDGITTGFVDILLPPCYEACKRLGLPYYVTPKMLIMSTSKIDFKNTCNEYGVPVPQTYFVGSEITDDIYQAINYPVFVKPLDGSGSRGAGVCNTREQLDAQFVQAKHFSVSNTVVIEDYLTGREFLLNYVAVNGEYRLISMFDRYICGDRGSAINYSNLAISPSKAIHQYLNDVNNKVISMFKNLGFTDGIFFLQGYAKDDKITFFEMGCRLGGSYYNLERACINIDPVDMIIRYALTSKMMDKIEDVPVDVANYKKTAICINYLLKGMTATIGSIRGLKEVKNLPSCISYEQRHFVGDYYSNERTVDRPVLSLYLVEDSLESARKDVNYLNSIFEVKDENGESLLMQKFNLNNF